MKITIIKSKTGINMKPNSNNLISHWPNHQFYILLCVFTICSLIFDISNRFRRTKKTPFMQNEPNFRKTLLKLSAVIADSYNKKPLVNHKKTNPFEPNTNPIPKQPKINPNFCNYRNLQRKTSFAPKKTNPIQTQTNPNQIQFPVFHIPNSQHLFIAFYPPGLFQTFTFYIFNFAFFFFHHRRTQMEQHCRCCCSLNRILLLFWYDR